MEAVFHLKERSVSCVEVYVDFHNNKRYGVGVGAGWRGGGCYEEAEGHHLEIQPESGSRVCPLLRQAIISKA